MKKLELFFTFLQLPIDYLLLFLAAISAYSLRFTSTVTAIRPVIFGLSFAEYWPRVLLVGAAWILVFILFGLYSTNPNRKLARDIAAIIAACSTGFAGITIYVFFTLQKFDSRFLVLAGWILSMIFIILGRIAIRLIKRIFYRFGFGLKRTVIIGNAEVSETVANVLRQELYLGHLLIQTYPQFTKPVGQEILGLKIDEMIYTNPKANEDELLRCIDFTKEHHITFKYSADLFSTLTTNISLSTLAGIPIIELRRTSLEGWGRIIKRLIDILGSIILMFFFSPLFVVTAFAILIETGRPIIYKNTRVGQNGKKFSTLKFRSMYQADCTTDEPGGAAALKKEKQLIKLSSKSGPVYKIKNDPRVTPVGRFLRAFSLDELPQFYNVLCGEMSLVGPRPHQPREVDQYAKDHKIVLAIKPGITGLPQISGRSNLSFDEEVKLDTFYIENWSLWLDCIILAKTPLAVIKKEGATI